MKFGFVVHPLNPAQLRAFAMDSEFVERLWQPHEFMMRFLRSNREMLRVGDADWIAREPTNVMLISRQLFLRVLGEFPGSAEKLRQAMGTRLRQFTRELAAVRRNRMMADGGEFTN